MPAPGGKEDGEPLDAALGTEAGDVRQVEREPHQGPQHGERQLLLTGHPHRVLDPLRRAVEEAAVLEHHPDVRPGAGARADAGGTRVVQRLVLCQLLFQERREPARLTEAHDSCARPSPRP